MTATANHPPLSIGWITLPTATPVELIEAAASADIRRVGITIGPRPENLSKSIASDPARLRELEACLRHHGVSLSEMGGVWVNGPRPSSWCLPAFEAGARLGASHAIALITERDAAKRLDDFCDLCDAAAQFGIGIAIEFVVYSTVKTVEDAALLAQLSQRKNASVLVDALHLHRSGGSASSLRHVPSHLISIAQLCDAPAVAPTTVEGLQAEARRDRLDPGEGDLPLRDFVAALPPGMPLELEVPKLSASGMTPSARIQQLALRTREFLASIPSRQASNVEATS